MENSTNEENAKGTSRGQSSRSAKKGGRKSANTKSDNQPAAHQLIKRGRNVVTRAEQWASSAARIASPLSDASSNAVVMGMLGLGVGLAIGAMLPRMDLRDLLHSGESPAKNRGKGRGRKN